MTERVRFLEHVLRARLARARRITLLSGPRKVGKTTLARSLATDYLNWHSLADRRLILRGPRAVADQLGLGRQRERDLVVVFDNLQGCRKWKSFLRGLRALHGSRLRVIVTGLESGAESARTAGSLLHRVHPWSVGECVRRSGIDSPIHPPTAIADEDWAALVEHGGFPEPFLNRDARFTRRWHARRQHESVGTELFSLASVREFPTLQLLALLLSERSGTQLFYSHLSRELGVSVDTIRRWVGLLVRTQYGFLVRPWWIRVPKGLRKEPKWFLRDWSGVATPSARQRTLLACHLLKAVDGWTDLGFGRFELRYVRDKARREVDFLVTRERQPWFLLTLGEAGEAAPALGYFQHCIRAPHAFHVVFDAPYVAADCFERTTPSVVSARTLLSQLL